MATDWIIKPHAEEWVEYRHHFDYVDHPGSGYTFECNPDGTLKDPTPQGEANFAECLTGTVSGQAVIDLGLSANPRRWFNSGTIRCRCGLAHQLQRGDSACEHCGQLFNAAGQELIPRSQWEGEPYDY